MSAVREANGIEIGTLVTQPTTEARRLAAEFPRGSDAIDKIKPSVSWDATVWLADSGGEHGTSFHIPDGWTVEHTFVGECGKVAIDVTRDS